MSSFPPQGPGAAPPPPPPPPPQPPSFVPPPSGPGLAWETQAIGPESFFDTFKLFVMAPEEAWRRTRESGDFMRPLLFGVIIGWVGLVFRTVWGTVFGAGLMRMIPPQYASQFTRFGGGGSLLVNIILGPIFLAIFLFIATAILHVSFMIVGALANSKSQFEGTFRLLAYASVANIANVVPILGGLAGGVWMIYLVVVGAQQLHKTSSGKALFGVLLPVVVCCVCIGAAVVMGIAAASRAFGH